MITKLLNVLRAAGVMGATSLILVGTSRAAPVVSLDPVTQTIPVGGTAFVNLNITGLGDAPLAPSLGSWLAFISYDAGIVGITAADVVFGNDLDFGVFGSLRFVDDSTPGLIKADETSFEDATLLDASQPGAFKLATYAFTGLAPGITSLTFNRLELGDQTGFPLAHTSTTASITVRGVNGVPDSGSVALPFALCVGILVLVHRRRFGQLASSHKA